MSIQQDEATKLFYFTQPNGNRSAALYATAERTEEEYLECLAAYLAHSGNIRYTPINEIVSTFNLDDFVEGASHSIRVVSESGRIFYGELKEVV